MPKALSIMKSETLLKYLPNPDLNTYGAQSNMTNIFQVLYKKEAEFITAVHNPFYFTQYLQMCF